MSPAPLVITMRFASRRHLLPLVWLVALAACGGGGETSGPPVVVNPPTVRGVTVTPSAATIRVNETQSLSAVVDAINGAGTGVTWSRDVPFNTTEACEQTKVV